MRGVNKLVHFLHTNMHEDKYCEEKMKKSKTFFIVICMSSTLLSQVDYVTEIQPIFNSNCITCHGSSGGLNLTSYPNLMSGNSSHGPVIIPFDEQNSVLVQKISPNPPFGDRMPRNNPTYFDGFPDQLQAIMDWINEGALEQPAVAVDKNPLFPKKLFIYQNFPNPFNPVTTLRYFLPERAEVILTIYDVLGRQVRTLVKGIEEPGFKSVFWEGSDDSGQSVSAGEYLYQIRTRLPATHIVGQAGQLPEVGQADDFVQTRKMVLLR